MLQWISYRCSVRKRPFYGCKGCYSSFGTAVSTWRQHKSIGKSIPSSPHPHNAVSRTYIGIFTTISTSVGWRQDGKCTRAERLLQLRSSRNRLNREGPDPQGFNLETGTERGAGISCFLGSANGLAIHFVPARTTLHNGGSAPFLALHHHGTHRRSTTV